MNQFGRAIAITPANEPTHPAPLAAKRCELCERWMPGWAGAHWLGLCSVRPGALSTWSVRQHACDVNEGRAFKPIGLPA